MGEKLERFRESDADDREPTTIHFRRAATDGDGAFSFAGERERGRAEDRHMDGKFRDVNDLRHGRPSDGTTVAVVTGTVSPLPLFQTLFFARQKFARASRVILINGAGQNKVRD